MTKTKWFSKIIITLLSIVLVISSCNKFEDLKSPVRDFNIILNYDIFDTFITLRLIDAPTGDLIGAADNEQVTVEISGNGSGAVVDQMGNHSTTYQSVNGIVSIALNPNDPWVPSEENVQNIIFEAYNDQYKPTGRSVKIDTTGTYTFDIYLEKKNADRSGVKEYTLKLPLNEEGLLPEDFRFTSTGNEVTLEINKGTAFADNEGNPADGNEIILKVKVFLNFSKAGVPTRLINTLKQLNGKTEQRAVDFYSLVEVAIFDEDGNEIEKIQNGEISLKNRPKNNSYNPAEKRPVKKNDDVFAYSFNNSVKYWEEKEQIILKEDSLGLYAEFRFAHPSYKATGNSAGTCSLTGGFQMNFTNDFNELPVEANVNLYRKWDNRHIGTERFQIEQDKQLLNYNFISIENEPVRLKITEQSRNNPFIPEPGDVYPEVSCGNAGNKVIQITSTRVEVNGKLQLHLPNELPEDKLEVFVLIRRLDDNATLYREKYILQKNDTTLNISFGMAAETDVYLNVVSASGTIQVKTQPARINFNSSGGPFIWEMDLIPEKISSEFIFNFNINPEFGDDELWIQADFYNRNDARVEKSTTFKISRNNSTKTVDVVLTKNTPFRVNIKRVAGKKPFMAYPYQQLFTSAAGQSIPYNVDISPVVKEYVEATIKIKCGSSIIYPTINGMYRSVWDTNWKTVEIKEGRFSGWFEIGATYQIGTVFKGVLVSNFYEITSNEIDMIMEMEGDFCDEMGW